MHSYILAGIRMGPLMTLLRKHGFTPSPRNLGRLLFVFQNALWSSLLSWREKKVFGEKLSSFEATEDPVIIIGHWRTGSTFLHQLLSLDKQFVAPTFFQCAFPDSFLVSHKYFRPVFKAVISKRPMDNVHMGFDDAQEDEFALLKLSPGSPLLNIVFPSKPGYFLDEMQDFNPEKEYKDQWKNSLINFCAKVRQDSGKTILLKNPAHSLRIPLLKEVFPHAKFIYLHRHPYKVVASSLHLWKVMARDNQLKGKPYFPGTEEVTKGLIKFYDAIERELAALPAGDYCKVRFKEMEAYPVAEIKRIYQSIGLDFTEDFENSLRLSLEKEKDFKKNSYNFDEDQRALVYRLMKKQFEQYHYKP